MSEKAPANVIPQASIRASSHPRQGGKWIRYLVACTHAVQSLVNIGQDVPAVMYALAQGHQGKTMCLLVDVLLFSLSVGMAAVSDASMPTPPTDSAAISDGEDEDMGDAVEGVVAAGGGGGGGVGGAVEGTPKGDGTPKGKDEEEVEQGTGGGLDLVGGTLRCISMLLRAQWRAEAEGLGGAGDAQAAKKRKKSWGAAGSGAAVLFVGDTNLKKLMVEHTLMPRTLVGAVLDALAALFRELDTSSGPRRKNLLLYVAGAMETMFVLRCCNIVVARQTMFRLFLLAYTSVCVCVCVCASHTRILISSDVDLVHEDMAMHVSHKYIITHIHAPTHTYALQLMLTLTLSVSC